MTAEAPSPAGVWMGLACAALALVLRWHHLDQGVSSDELANLQAGGVWTQLWLPESAINPPVIRMVGAASSSPLEVLRAASLVGGCLAVALVPAITMAMGAPAWVALCAGVVVAAHPAHVAVSTTARAYGWVQAMLAVHVLAVLRWSEAPTRRHGAVVSVTAAVLPWLHYLSLPMLPLVALGLSRGRDLRRVGRLYLPAALLALPLLAVIVVQGEARPPLREGPVPSLAAMARLGLHGFIPGDLWLRPAAESVLLAGMVVCIAAALLRPPVDARDRLSRWFVLAPLLIVVPLAAFKSVRTPATTVALVTLWPALLARLSRMRGGAVWSLAALGWVGLHVWGERTHPRYPRELRDELRVVGRELHGLVPPGGTLTVVPGHRMQPILFHATGQPPFALSHDPRCGDRLFCAVVDGRHIEGAERVDGPGTYLVIDSKPPPPGPGQTPITRHITKLVVD